MVPQCLPHKAKCLSSVSKAPYNLDPLLPSQPDFPSATHTASILIRQLSNYCCTYYAFPCWKYSVQNSLLPLILPLAEFQLRLSSPFSLQCTLTSLFSAPNQDPCENTLNLASYPPACTDGFRDYVPYAKFTL